MLGCISKRIIGIPRLVLELWSARALDGLWLDCASTISNSQLNLITHPWDRAYQLTEADTLRNNARNAKTPKRTIAWKH